MFDDKYPEVSEHLAHPVTGDDSSETLSQLTTLGCSRGFPRVTWKVLLLLKVEQGGVQAVTYSKPWWGLWDLEIQEIPSSLGVFFWVSGVWFRKHVGGKNNASKCTQHWPCPSKGSDAAFKIREMFEEGRSKYLNYTRLMGILYGCPLAHF